ncbi:MAG: threonine--tRNA ligase [Acidimicrobiales bacterium]
MGEVTIRLPDGSTKALPERSAASDLARALGRRLASAAVAATVDGEAVDLAARLPDGAQVRIITSDSPEGREVIRHSSAHVMAQAVLALYPGAKYAIGPAIEDGFYYDFALPGDAHLSDDDLSAIEGAMREVISQDQPFVRSEHSVEDALELFSDQPFKTEIIEAVRDGAAEHDASAAGPRSQMTVSVYANGEHFVDLCRGPHVPSTARLGHFKLTRVAGAYWRGDERRPQLQRVYGTAWESKAALERHLARIEEAERRDHRKLGAELDLFSFPEELGSGLAIFHPKGGTIRRLMEDFSRARHAEAGYDFVFTPHITKEALFATSGHLESFADGLYPPMELDGGQRYYLRPMNCPFHILVYRSRSRSYRELPLRLFEFGSVYRYELSGVVHGLTRVRGMTQDDAHIFCTQDQVREEVASVLDFVLSVLRAFGLDDFYLELSTRPEDKAMGADQDWEVATQALRDVGSRGDLDLVLDEGGGAFYGPKISVQARDAIGRTHQLSTIQLDLQLPKRFALEYTGADNVRHTPVMIHRALFGAVERFLAILLEHYAGALPTWLMPEQVRVLPVKEDNHLYAQRVLEKLSSLGLRATLEVADTGVGARVARAKVHKIPYVLVVGDSDVAATTVGVNRRGAQRPERDVPLERFVAEVTSEVAARSPGPQADGRHR